MGRKVSSLFMAIIIVMVQSSVLMAAPSATKGSEVTITASPTILSIVVPAKIGCTIDPNQEVYPDSFTSANLEVENTSKATVSMKVKVTTLPTNPMKIVAEKTPYATDDAWKALNANLSKANIALGIKEVTSGFGGDQWFSAQTAGNETNTLTLGEIASGKKKSLKLQAKHGLAFNEQIEIKYSVVFIASLT